MIVIANLIGGMVVGVVHARHVGPAEAMRTYSMLSIGAGLVAQIPSLIVAVRVRHARHAGPASPPAIASPARRGSRRAAAVAAARRF